MTDEEFIQQLRDDPLINTEWLDKVLNGEKACKTRCYFCILYNRDICLPRQQ